MTVEINGKTYECRVHRNEPIDAYLYKGILYDTKPKACSVRQFVITDDDMYVGVCTSSIGKVALAVIAVIIIACITVFAISEFVKTMQGFREPLPKSDVEVIDASTEDAVVSIVKDTDYILTYNRYSVYEDGYIDIMYQNIDVPVTLWVKGDGIRSDKVSVKANEYLPSIAITVDEDVELPARVELLVEIDGDDYVVPIVINDPDDVDYQSLRQERSSENRVNLNDSNEEGSVNTDWSNPSTYENEERLIND